MNVIKQSRFFIVLSSVVTLFGCLLPLLNAQEPSTADEVGKLYVINVWGSNAEDYQSFLSEAFESSFNMKMVGSGLNPASRIIDPVTNEPVNVNFCEEYITLSGDSATNNNVLATCRNISQKAKKNDVIFVYMCCHAKTVRLEGDNKRYHILFPGIQELSEMRNNANGIKRSDIIKALQPQAHRLTVLITDSSTCEMDSIAKSVKRFHILDRGLRMFGNNRLWLLLRTNTGLIDWNSTSPFGGLENQGEFISIYQYGRVGGMDSAPSPRNNFLEAFIKYGFSNIEPDVKNISASEFFYGLKKELADEFDRYKENAVSDDSNKVTFYNQPTQTLFDFKGRGFVIDNRYGGNKADNQVGKLYTLTIWGGGDLEEKGYNQRFRIVLKEIFQKCGLSKKSLYMDANGNIREVGFCAEEIELSDSETNDEYKVTNNNVLEKCRYLGKKAGKNDVIFVYMFCHGKTARIDRDNKRYHILYPDIENQFEMQDNSAGILRSEIIKALNPDAHRLTVLITDSCTYYMDQEAKDIQRYPLITTQSLFSNNRLWLLLRTNTGLIDWNSTSPYGGYDKQGEYSWSYQMSAGIDMGSMPKSIFLDSFLNYCSAWISANKNEISQSDFFNGLKNEQNEEFKRCKNDESIRLIRPDLFDHQPTQTLFDFKGLGYVTN